MVNQISTSRPIILGIDTSGEYCSVGLVQGEKILGEISICAPREHSVQLIPSIDKILKENNLRVQQIDGIAVSIGPGCFTGLRVGVATAKALAQGLNIPIVGVPTLDMIALNAVDIVKGDSPHLHICPIVDARKQQVYTALYRYKIQDLRFKIKKITKDLAVTIEELLTMHDQAEKSLPLQCRMNATATVFIGNAIQIYGDKIKDKLGKQAIFAPQELWYPRASNVALTGTEQLRRKKRGDKLFKLKPIYVREPDIRAPKKPTSC